MKKNENQIHENELGILSQLHGARADEQWICYKTFDTYLYTANHDKQCSLNTDFKYPYGVFVFYTL